MFGVDELTKFQFNLNQEEQKKIADRIGLPEGTIVENLNIKDYLLAQTNESEDDKYKRLRNAKLDVEIAYKKLMIDYFKTFHTPPTPRGENALKTKSEIENNFQSPYDEKNNRLQCNECGQLFGGTISEQKDSYVDHLELRHQRPITEIEMNILSVLK